MRLGQIQPVQQSDQVVGEALKGQIPLIVVGEPTSSSIPGYRRLAIGECVALPAPIEAVATNTVKEDRGWPATLPAIGDPRCAAQEQRRRCFDCHQATSRHLPVTTGTRGKSIW